MLHYIEDIAAVHQLRMGVRYANLMVNAIVVEWVIVLNKGGVFLHCFQLGNLVNPTKDVQVENVEKRMTMSKDTVVQTMMTQTVTHVTCKVRARVAKWDMCLPLDYACKVNINKAKILSPLR